MAFYKFWVGRLATSIFALQSTCRLVAASDVSDSAHAFSLGQVSLEDSRWTDNQNRTLSYLLSVDVDRLLYNFRSNHDLDTKNAQKNGGWDAPDFPFRTHIQGHFLTAWAQCYAALGNEECRDRAVYFTEELEKCQENNEKAGFNEGYLSGFPETEFEVLENRTLDNGNVPYYCIHKTLAGLLDVHRLIGVEKAKSVMLSLAAWVDARTSKLSYDEMQSMMQTEFGGMNEVLADIASYTEDDKWLSVAQRFDHAVIFDPLTKGQDRLNGLHANTQVPKWIGAILEYKLTGDQKYFDIAYNSWNLTVHKHSYAIGGNSQGEHFREPDAIAAYLTDDTCEACNSYNMLKLTRELWALDPSNAGYFDFYENALMNHLLGQQDPHSDHGHITYFTPLNPGGHRGIGPVWGGGTWSTDYDSFWCCQGSGLETNTKFMDSVYFHGEDTLYVNLFMASQVQWKEKDVTIRQESEFPEADTITLRVDSRADSEWTLAVRVPSWTSDAVVKLNGEAVEDVAPGAYVTLKRQWSSNDTVTLKFPMSLHVKPANDDSSVAALAYGPVILAANYGDSTLDSVPALDLETVERVGESGLRFKGEVGGEEVELGPFYDAHGFNYNVYWKVEGKLS